MANEQQKQLGPSDMEIFEQISTRWDAKIAQGLNSNDLLVPAFWAHQAVKLKPMDEIRARAEDGTWVADYLVLDCSRTWANVKLLSLHMLTTSDVSLSQSSQETMAAFIQEHKIVWRAAHKWSVVRKADGAVLLEGKEQKDDAIDWLARHAREQFGVLAPVAEKAAPVEA